MQCSSRYMMLTLLLLLGVVSAQIVSNATISVPSLMSSAMNSTATASASAPNATISIDPQQPAGRLVMQTPSLLTGMNLFKIGSNITFSWTYNNLIVTPKQLNVEFYCQDCKRWVVGAYNLSGGITSYNWNSGNASPPISTGTYVVWIYDERGRLGVTQPGYLSPYSSLQIALYQSQPYQPLDGSMISNEASTSSLQMLLLLIGLFVSVVGVRL